METISISQKEINTDDHLLNIAICDDNPIHLQTTRDFLDRYLRNVRHHFYCYSKSNDLLEECKEQPFSLAIMDIQLEGENGILAAHNLREAQPLCKIIFVSSYAAYAQDVYDVDHVAFVLKKDMELYLPRAITRLLSKAENNRSGMISIDSEGCWILVPKNQIIYIERNIRKTLIYIKKEHAITQIVTTEKIESVLERLNDIAFVQCHKSYVINWIHVTGYAKGEIRLSNEKVLPISRQKAGDVLASFQKWSFTE